METLSKFQKEIQLLVGQSKFDLALKKINKELVHNKNNPDYLFMKSIILIYMKKFSYAILILEDILKIQPSSELFCNLGICYKSIGKIREAVDAYKKSLALNPQNLQTILNLASLHNENFNFQEAILLINNSLNIFPGQQNLLEILMTVYRDSNDLIKSKEVLTKLLEKYPNNILYNFHLAYTNYWLNDYPETIKILKSCINLNSHFIESYFILSKITSFDNLQSQIECIANINDNSLDFINNAYRYLTLSEYALYKNDDISFIEYLNKANTFKNKLVGYDESYYLNIYDYLLNKFDHTKYSLPSINSKQDLIFIVGMPRTGSSLVEQILSANPNIYAAGEIGLIHTQLLKSFKNLPSLSNESLVEIRDQYIELINYLTNKPIVIDKLPLNFIWIGIIKLMFPSAKFIHTHRDPFETCFSIYRNFFAESNLEFSYSPKNIKSFYLFYKNMMEFWNSQKDLEIFDFHFEDFVENPSPYSEKLFKFLTLEFKNEYLLVHQNNRPVKTASSSQLSIPIYKPKTFYSRFQKDFPDFIFQ